MQSRKNALLLLLLCISLAPSRAQAPAPRYVLKCGLLFQSKTADFVENQYVFVKNGRIEQVAPVWEKAAGDSLIDLSGYTLLPGLIDAHAHTLYHEIFSNASFQLIPDRAQLLDNEKRLALGRNNLRSYLQEGFTTVRDLGNSGDGLDLKLRDELASGQWSGARLFTSGRGISYLRGQYKPVDSLLDRSDYLIIRDSASAQAAVETLVRQQVDLIKTFPDNSPNSDLMPENLLRYIVTLAHQHRLKVSAHAIYDRSIQSAIHAKVDCIEHGYGLTRQTARLMRDSQIAFVPTFQDKAGTRRFIERLPRKKFLFRLLAPMELKNEHKTLQMALKNGVFICAGADMYVDDPANPRRGADAKSALFCLLEGGMPLNLALQAATWHSAVLLDREQEIGSVQAGALADLIAVEGDVRKHPKLLRNVAFVMLGGRMVR